jgi:hypothetical protein
MMELLRVCDPAVEACDKLCSGGPCGWDACAPGDDNCVRALTATECLLDPSKCPEALLRCAQCDDQSCPPEAQRCVPGCLADADCPLTDACDALGECVPAPCSPPCGPPAMCEHGVCVP